MEQAPERAVTTIRRTTVPHFTRFDDAWVTAQGWAPVPVGEIAHDAVSSVVQAFTRGHPELVACTCEPLDGWTIASWPREAVTLQPHEFDAWRAEEHIMVDVVLAEPDLSSAFLDTAEEHVLLGGTPARLDEGFGGDVRGAFDAFDRYAADMATGSRHLSALDEPPRDAHGGPPTTSARRAGSNPATPTTTSTSPTPGGGSGGSRRGCRGARSASRSHPLRGPRPHSYGRPVCPALVTGRAPVTEPARPSDTALGQQLPQLVAHIAGAAPTAASTASAGT
ncbi:hypothetical protein GCM10027047_35620 [Rhodococcus aerolatus]